MKNSHPKADEKKSARRIAVEIQNLSKRYKTLQALNHISFNVLEGDFFGFLGPNGAGKTTTISIITGLAHYQQGSVRVFGHDVTSDYRSARKMIGLVPQEFNFDPFLTAEQILTFEAGYFGVPRKEAKIRAEELLEEFDLIEYRTFDFRRLSGGLKRRLLIARALVHRPAILILDEPTAGLDLELRYRLWDFFRKINQSGTTIFLTTHYIEEAEKLCDRIGVIHKGHMVALDDKTKLIKQMSRDLIEIELDQSLTTVPQAFDEFGAELFQDGKFLRIREGSHSLSKLLKTIHAHGFEVLGVDIKRTTLEEVFLELTKKESGVH